MRGRGEREGKAQGREEASRIGRSGLGAKEQASGGSGERAEPRSRLRFAEKTRSLRRKEEKMRGEVAVGCFGLCAGKKTSEREQTEESNQGVRLGLLRRRAGAGFESLRRRAGERFRREKGGEAGERKKGRAGLSSEDREAEVSLERATRALGAEEQGGEARVRGQRGFWCRGRGRGLRREEEEAYRIEREREEFSAWGREQMGSSGCSVVPDR